MDVQDLVRSHYDGPDLAGHILSALAEAGVDVDHLGPADLFPVDQLHAGGAFATRNVLDRLRLAPGSQVLDVGCGIGGASRMAAMAGAEVTGVDLSPAFVETATVLTDRAGLGERATFVATAGEEMPLEDASYDAALMVHVGMNIPDKAAVFGDVHRVLRPGAPFAVYEQVRTSEGDLPYPLPWAVDERSSFVETVADYESYLQAAGFAVEEVEDLTPVLAGQQPPRGPVDNAVVFGPAFVERIGNNIAATRQGLLGSWVLVARA